MYGKILSSPLKPVKICGKSSTSAVWQGFEFTFVLIIFTKLFPIRSVFRDFEKGWRSMSATMFGRRRKFQLLDGQNNVRNYTLVAKYFYQHFQIFSIFIDNASLPTRSYQVFKICKRYNKEREKTHMHHSMEKEN